MNSRRTVFFILLSITLFQGCSLLKKKVDCRGELMLGFPKTADNPMGLPGSDLQRDAVRLPYANGQITHTFGLDYGYEVIVTIYDNAGHEDQDPYGNDVGNDEIHLVNAVLRRRQSDGSFRELGRTEDGENYGNAIDVGGDPESEEIVDGEHIVQSAHVECAPAEKNVYGIGILK